MLNENSFHLLSIDCMSRATLIKWTELQLTLSVWLTMKGLDDLAGLRVFERVIALGSLTAAAKELGISLAATSKRLAALEMKTGLALVHRSTRKLTVTLEGETLYRHAQRILFELACAEEALMKQQQQVTGTLKITAPNSFGRHILLPLIGEFGHLYPDLKIQLLLSDEVKDFIADGLDLAIRYGELPDSSLVARLLLRNQRILCAADSYLDLHGVPANIQSLQQHRCIVIGQHADTEWRFTNEKIHIKAHYLCNDGAAGHAMAVQGLGIVMKSYWDVAEDLSTGRLRQILPDTATANAPIHLVYQKTQDLTPRVQVFTDFLRKATQKLEAIQSLQVTNE